MSMCGEDEGSGHATKWAIYASAPFEEACHWSVHHGVWLDDARDQEDASKGSAYEEAPSSLNWR